MARWIAWPHPARGSVPSALVLLGRQGSEQAGAPLWLRLVQLLLVIGIVVCGVLLWREHRRIRALGRRARVASQRLVRRITARPPQRPWLGDDFPGDDQVMRPTSARPPVPRRAPYGGMPGDQATTGRTLAQRPGSPGWRPTAENPRVDPPSARRGRSLWDEVERQRTAGMPAPTDARAPRIPPGDQQTTGRRRVPPPPPPDADWMR